MSDTCDLEPNLVKLRAAIVANRSRTAVSPKNSAISVLLTLGVLLSAAPVYAASSQTGETKAQGAESTIQLKRIRYTAPKYPEKALQEQLSGYVTIEFVINTKGEPVQLKVLEGHHAEVFERALLTAAKRWRFKPLIVDNVPRETTMRTIVRFDTLT